MAPITYVAFAFFFIAAAIIEPTDTQLAGGWSSLDTMSEGVLEKAMTALNLYANSNTWNQPQHLIELIEAKSQVVSGINYEFKMLVGVGACMRPHGARNFTKYDSDCYFEKMAECTFKLWVQEWLDKHEITNSSCGKFKSAWKNIPLNDRVVVESTEVSLRRIRKGTSHTAQLNRMDQAYKNLLTPNVFRIDSRIFFKCKNCDKESVSRARFTMRSDGKRHVMARCEVDNKLVSANTDCSTIQAFPY